MSVYKIYRYWDSFQESDGYTKFIKYRLVYLLVLWKHKRMILCARKTLRSVGPALLFFLFLYILYISIYTCVSPHYVRFSFFLASLATLALFFLHLLLILIYFAYIFRNQRRCFYSEIYWLYFHRDHRERLSSLFLKNIALYFQNLIERLFFMCALAYARAQKLPLFSGDRFPDLSSRYLSLYR